MAKKLDTTPDGIICDTCGRDLPPYHFFSPRGKYDREFFVSGVPNGHTCFKCAGDYRCIRCQQIQPASAFRIGGRVCRSCRNAVSRSDAREKNARTAAIKPHTSKSPENG